MPSKETRRDRGRRLGQEALRKALHELVTVRTTNGLSQADLARLLKVSQSAVARMEDDELVDVGVVRLSEFASALGLHLAINLYPFGDALRDRAQLKVGTRLDSLLSTAWHVADETLLPGHGGLRAWDKTLRLADARPRHLVGVDIESRVRDIQALVRRTRLRERDGQADAILIVLADTRHNRSVVNELRSALGLAYATPQAAILAALREGRPLPGSGVILI